MATNQTENYGLNQWEASDKVLREEFNADNAKVEGALSGLAAQVAAKASKTDLNALTTQVNAKAAQTALDSLAATVAKKYGADLPILVEGSYVGTYSSTSHPTAVTVTLGFRPSFVIVFSMSDEVERYDDLVLMGTPSAHLIVDVGYSHTVETSHLTFSDTGFTVDRVLNFTCGFNLKGVTYHYFAFR